MPDRRALVRLVDELVWTLRRQGFVAAPSQVLDLLRAIGAVGWSDRATLREVTATVLGPRPSERARFEAVFDAYFARSAPDPTLWERLALAGFTEAETDALRELLETLARQGDGGERFAALLLGGFELDRLMALAGVRRELDDLQSPLQVGFFAQRASGALGLPAARDRLAQLRQHLRGALGERGDALADALAKELDRAGDALRSHATRLAQARTEARKEAGAWRKSADAAFTSLRDDEIDQVVRAVRAFAERLRGGEQVRTKRARRGRLDVSATMRAMTRTGGVPFAPVRRRRRRDRPRLVLLCDVSDSVRTASRFMLELVYAAHDVFARTRSFVFVSELGETTALFEREPWRRAIAAAYSGDVVTVTDNSNYGRVFRAFEDRCGSALDRRTTVVILGDGRTNYHDAAEESLARIRTRCRALYWFSTEPRTFWSSGDSAMSRYAPHCTKVFDVTTARELEAAARALVWSR
jgi:uncharacterized protein